MRTTISLTVVGTLVVGALAAAPASTSPAGAATTVVGISAGSADEAAAAAEAAGLVVERRYERFDGVVASGDVRAAAAIADAPGVVHVDSLDGELVPQLARGREVTRWVEATGYVDQPGARGMTLDEVRRLYEPPPTPVGPVLDGSGVGIAVVFDVADARHSTFADLETDVGDDPAGPLSRIRRTLLVGGDCRVDCGPVDVGRHVGDPFTTPAQFVADSNVTPFSDHGQMVTAVAAAGAFRSSSDGRDDGGFAPGADVYAFGARRSQTESGAFLDVLDWLVEHHVAPCEGFPNPYAVDCAPIRVVNMSYTSGQAGEPFDPDSLLSRAIRAVLAEGMTFVKSNGNHGDGDGHGIPADTIWQTGWDMDPTPGLIRVANYDMTGEATRDGQLHETSGVGHPDRPGSWPDLAGPGHGMWYPCSTKRHGCSSGIAQAGGTSASAPALAGIVAVLLQHTPQLTPADVEHLLEATAHEFTAGEPYVPDPDHPGQLRSRDKGHGLVDLQAAIEALGR